MKKRILLASVITLGILTVVDMVGGSKICSAGNLSCRTNLEGVLALFYPIPVLFLLSLLTYRMRDEVFYAWWSFARWWVPVIVVVTLLLHTASGTGGGYIGMGKDFIFLIQGILYSTLILVSLIKIIRAYKGK